MSGRKHLRLLSVLVVTLLLALGGVVITSASDDASPAEVPPEIAAIAPQADGPIIIDHTCTDLSQIPDYWLEQAKALLFHYAHTSHGGQILTGMETLAQSDSKYDYYRLLAPPDHDPDELPTHCQVGDELCIYDGQPGYAGHAYESYITPDLYWDSPDGITRTHTVADTGLYAYSMWSWCGQQSSNSEATVQEYLDTIAGFETAYPDMRFILMTGHTDGGSATLERNNNMVRQYAQDYDMVLFDFADIETYNPLGGGPYDNDSEGNCTWCVDFCAAHPEYCTDLPGSCGHSDNHPEDTLFCKLKANAFWWMLARLAGWDGVTAGESSKTASADMAVYGDVVSYTIVVQGLAAPPAATVSLADAVPAGLTYVPGTLAATGGVVDDAAAPLLRWTGLLTPTPAVTVTYAVSVTYGDGTAIIPVEATNTATIAAEGGAPITHSATLVITPTVVAPDFAPSIKSAGSSRAGYGDGITYTVSIRDANGPLGQTVLFTDAVPSGLAYVPGSLAATSGTPDDSAAPTLTWSGVLSPTPAVTLTYVVSVTTAMAEAIANTATIAAPGITSTTRSAVVVVNGYGIYLPLALRSRP